MDRGIIDFRRDADGDWVAQLDCGHGQHVRHHPPFFSRPWTESPSGREAMLGTTLACVRCDRLELPEGFAPYKRTGEFTETTVPGGLRANHTTKSGVWARIEILEGRLDYVVEAPVSATFALAAGDSGIVAPEIPHRVEPHPGVRFFVEFYRRRDDPL